METVLQYWRRGEDIAGRGIVSKETGTYMGIAERFTEAGSLCLKDSGTIRTAAFGSYLVVEPREPR